MMKRRFPLQKALEDAQNPLRRGHRAGVHGESIQQSFGNSKEVRLDCQLFAGRLQLHRFLRILRGVLPERLRNAAEPLRGSGERWEIRER